MAFTERLDTKSTAASQNNPWKNEMIFNFNQKVNIESTQSVTQKPKGTQKFK